MDHASQMVLRKCNGLVIARGHNAGAWEGLCGHLLGFQRERLCGLYREQEDLGKEDTDYRLYLGLWGSDTDDTNRCTTRCTQVDARVCDKGDGLPQCR